MPVRPLPQPCIKEFFEENCFKAAFEKASKNAEIGKGFKYYLVLLGSMENLSIKLETAIARQIEKTMQEFNYSTKTEFVRDAIRTKLKELGEEKAKKKAWEALFAARGMLKGKGKFKTDEEWHDWRSNVFSKQLERELAEKYGWKA